MIDHIYLRITCLAMRLTSLKVLQQLIAFITTLTNTAVKYFRQVNCRADCVGLSHLISVSYKANDSCFHCSCPNVIFIPKHDCLVRYVHASSCGERQLRGVRPNQLMFGVYILYLSMVYSSCSSYSPHDML